MPNRKKKRTDSKKSRTRRNTAANKIRHIEKALLVAGGKAKEQLEQRLEFWKKQL